jgi:hypothetical protein
MTETFTLELTLDELHMLDKYVEYCEETKEFFDKLKDAYPKPDVIEIGGVKYQRIDEPPKPMDGVVDRLIKQHQAKKLWNILSNKYDYVSATCDDIVSAVEEWLPEPQSAAGSQNVYVECSVEGFNDCLKQIKGMIR